MTDQLPAATKEPTMLAGRKAKRDRNRAHGIEKPQSSRRQRLTPKARLRAAEDLRRKPRRDARRAALAAATPAVETPAPQQPSQWASLLDLQANA